MEVITKVGHLACPKIYAGNEVTKILKIYLWGLLFPLGSCSVILYVAAVGIALLLLSIIDVWKLKFGLAPYCITAGIGAFILAVMIKKSWMIQSLLLDTSTDKKHWKLKQLHHSGLCPEKGQESTDPMDSFSLPQCICVMVSNYQQLQAIFAIPKGECHTREIRPDEQFSPIVTIVDTATQQPLDCVLLLHGEKPPEVTCRTLFCYIAVKVTVFQDCDGHDSHPHPLYHIKSKPCKQGKLPLTFCFHQPGTVCVIQLSIHSIVDSEGVEYIRQSQDFTCTCLVHVIDRNQHSVVKVTGQHGVARIKEPPLLRYTGPLATTQYHKIETRFTKLFRTANHKHMQQLSKEVVFTSSSSPDIKVFALCWEALSEAVQLGNYVRAERLLRAAWKKATKLECANGLLLQGRVLRHVSFIQYEQNKDAKALEYMSQAKKILFLAAPSEETAHALYTELLVKKRKFFSTPNLEFFSQLLPFENECELLLEHAKYMEEYEKQAHCSFRMMKASFHLRSDLITNKLPPKEFWPSPDDLKKAEKCLENVGLNIMCQSNSYKARYFCTVCDLDIWKQKYNMAIDYLEEARKVSEMPCINQRFQLIERLKKR